jgi:hypothetical protein
MSKHGNGYIFRIQRSNKIVELDSKDVKFNETFSDCIDRQGKMIKGGRVLNPDLMETTKTHQQNEVEEQPDNENEHRIPDDESESDNEPEESYENDKPDNDNVNDSSSSNSSDEDEQEKRNKVTFSMRKIEPKKPSEPIKISTSLKKSSRAVKMIQSSEGFSKASQNTSSEKNFENPDQSETRKSKREPKIDKCMRQTLNQLMLEKIQHFLQKKKTITWKTSPQQRQLSISFSLAWNNN